jgi:predicted phage tail component-like protein
LIFFCGQYYFGTQVDQRVFNVSFAFDKLTDEDFRKLKQVFNGDGIHPLIFDEDPYKVYMAKVTGSTNVKHLCFEVNNQREYRGEGTL